MVEWGFSIFCQRRHCTNKKINKQRQIKQSRIFYLTQLVGSNRKLLHDHKSQVFIISFIINVMITARDEWMQQVQTCNTHMQLRDKSHCKRSYNKYKHFRKTWYWTFSIFSFTNFVKAPHNRLGVKVGHHKSLQKWEVLQWNLSWDLPWDNLTWKKDIPGRRFCISM